MAGKRSEMTTFRLHRVLDKLSKNTWIELAVDRARAEIGEDAPDEAIMDLIQTWLDPVCRFRGDRPVDLCELAMKYDTLELKYMALRRANAAFEADQH